MMETGIALIVIVLLIAITFYLARRQALTCPECKNKKCKKTGNRKVIERERRALIAGPFPNYDYEYECKNCAHKFWSSIESISGE